MAISYPLALPTYPTAAGLERVRFSDYNATALLRSPWSGHTQTQEHPGKMLMAEVTVAECKRAQAAPWIAFLSKLKGPVGTFYLGDPSMRSPRGVASGTPKVNGSVSSLSETITTKGWAPSVTGILKESDYIQIGARLYRVLQDVNSDGSGNCTLDVFPPVREALTDNTTIVTESPMGLFRLPNSEVSTHEPDAKTNTFAISFLAVEAI